MNTPWKPEKPEDEGDFLKDIGELANDAFRPQQPAPERKDAQEPRRVPITNGDDDDGCTGVCDGCGDCGDEDPFLAALDDDYEGFFIPVFSLGELDKGEFTEDDLDTTERLRPFLTCPECNAPDTICDQMFGHLAEAAIWRIAVLCSEIEGIVTGLRQKLAMMGANTYDSVDLTVLTIAGEIARLKCLIPKLHAAQEGMDSF